MIVAGGIAVFIWNKHFSVSADADLTPISSCGNTRCEKNESSVSCPQDCDAVSDVKTLSLPGVDYPLSTTTLPLNQPLEKGNWGLACKLFPNGSTCSADTRLIDKKIDGKTPLTLKGSRSSEIQYLSPLYTAEPNTDYEIVADIKITNRNVYKYLDMAYPDNWYMKTRGTLDSTKGIWGGQYSIGIFNKFPDSSLLTFTQPKDMEAPFRNASETDWFHEEKTINSGISGTIQFLIDLKGFDGNLSIDNLTIRKAASIIPESTLHLPIESWDSSDPNHAPTISIISVVKSPPTIITNSAKFSFVNDQLSIEKDGQKVSDIRFPIRFLDGLVVSQKTDEPGIVIVENQNIVFSVGADSTVLTKCKSDCQISIGSQISGQSKGYHYFSDGIIFATDYNMGIFFTPIKTDSQIMQSVEKTSSPAVPVPGPNDNWQIINWFTEFSWKINYNIKSGSGFLIEAFPPKGLNETKYCNELVTLARERNGNIINLNQKSGLDPKNDYQKDLQAIKDSAGNNVTPYIILWMNGYAITKNEINPPDNYTYYLGSDNNQYFKDAKGNYWPTPSSGVKIGSETFQGFTPKVDVAGPFLVQQKEALQKFNRQAHAKGIKVILYMSPKFYYTSDVDRFMANLKTLMEGDDPATAVDGIYYDGIYYLQPLKTLELVRTTRNLLKDKIYIQHTSWTYSVIKNSFLFRVPVFDIYADELLTGENILATDNNTWTLNYCGKNVSNTISNLLDSSRPPDTSADQIKNTLSCDGKIFVRNVVSPNSLAKPFLENLKKKCRK